MWTNYSALPPGFTGIYQDGKITISGTPTETGTFYYIVRLTGRLVS